MPCPVETVSVPKPLALALGAEAPCPVETLLVPKPLAIAPPVSCRRKPAPQLPDAERAGRYELMSVDGLKDEIAQRGLDTLFCFSREDLVQRLREAEVKPWHQEAACLMQHGTLGPGPAARPIVRTAYATPGACRAPLAV